MASPRKLIEHAINHKNINEFTRQLNANIELIDVPDICGQTFLHLAAIRGFTDAIILLIRLGSQAIDATDTSGWTPLHLAASCGRSTIVELLFQLGSKTISRWNDFGYSPIHTAVRNGHVSVVETLIRLDKKTIHDVARYGGTPLCEAMATNQIDIIDMFRYLGVELVEMTRVFLPSKEYDEEKALEIRRRIFFQRSLLQRCFDYPNRGLLSATRI